MNRPLNYHFEYIESCNMCGSRSDSHKILGKRLNRSQGTTPQSRVGISTTILKCSNCGLIYSNPQPQPQNLQDHYGVPPEDYWKENYFSEDEHYFSGEINRLRSLMEIKPGMKSLDIGAGLGKAMIAMKRAGLDAYGLEPSLPFYERAVTRMGISPTRLHLGKIEEADYPEAEFDFITFGAVLEHLYDPSMSILRALKWLKPGGFIHVEIPSADWLINRLINLFYRMGRTDYVGNISPMHEPYHLYEFGLKSFQEHSRKNGYELAFYEYYVCQTYMPKFADYVLKQFMKRTNTGMELCVWLRKKTQSELHQTD